MNKLKAFVLGLIAIAIVGCSGPKTVTTYEQSPKKDPNGNIRVVHLAIKSVTPVFYNYKTDEETCSEVKFLQQVTGIKEGPKSRTTISSASSTPQSMFALSGAWVLNTAIRLL